MSGCGNCCGNCGGCGEMVLAAGEIEMLKKLAQIPFLPVSRRADSPDPVYLEDGDCSPEQYSQILLCLEKRGLISLDYDLPLQGFRGPTYDACPIHGSFALTARGQEAVEILELNGLSDA